MRAWQLVVGTFFVLASGLSLAGEQTGTVQIEYGQFGSSATSAGYTFFYLQGSPKLNTPPCNVTFNGRWVINNSWPAAKIQTAILLVASTAGRQVKVTGSGNCNVWGDSETAIDIRLID